MARFVKRDGRWVSASTGEPLLSDEERKRPIAVPHYEPDITPYESPIDGRWISSRSERRDDLKRNNCLDARDFPSPTGGKIRNAEFAAKRGLQVSEEFR